MKKFIITIILALVASISFTSYAQWQTPKYYPADDLTGTNAYYSNLYVGGEMGALVIWSNEDDVKLMAGRGIFDYDDNYVSVLVGFYEGDKLVEKVSAEFYVPNGDSNTAYTSDYKNPNLAIKIINHLRTKGKVRFVASKYSGPDFDLTVPMNKNLKRN